ncbi:MAG: ATP-dependent sacrificial sulfur transferase LarE [Planctomycetota bacterium]|jgi:uncharacterized protein
MSYEKYDRLRGILQGMKSVLVAFSGGVDSTFLLKVAHDELKDRAVAVTATCGIFPKWELDESKQTAAEMGARQLIVETREMENAEFRANPDDRCYICKKDRFGSLLDVAKEQGLNCVAHGEVADDRDDHRPGARAAEELGVRAPLAEAGLTKAEVRALSKELGLPTWDKPSFACLASRIPYGEEITLQKLFQVDRGEKLLRELGFRQFRVRHHGDIARIELLVDDIARASGEENRARILEHFASLGFKFVALDLKGYRTGSLNP